MATCFHNYQKFFKLIQNLINLILIINWLQNNLIDLNSYNFKMSASQNQSELNSTTRAGAHFDPTSNSDASSTPFQSAASATAAGHGPHPQDNADESNVSLPGSRIGPQQEDLEGEQMRMAGEDQVMDAQFNKKNAGWGEQDSLKSDLDRKKAEQQGARREIQAERYQGQNVDGGAGGRIENEVMSQA
jgi:hypothetical protein